MSIDATPFDRALLESDERRALRSAVGALGRRYGRTYFTETVRPAGSRTSCGRRRAGSATSG